jgi:O-antigen biosynthesis protein
VLVVAPYVPDFDRASGSLRLYLMLGMLARRYRVMCLGRVNPGDPQAPRYVRALEEIGIEVHPAQRVDVVDKVGQVGLCVFFEFFATAEQALGRVRRKRPDLPVVVDSVDLHFLRERRAANFARRPWLARLRAAWTKKRELSVYRRADLILTVTENDRAEVLRELPDARVAVIPNIHKVRDTVPGFSERQRNSVLFVGGFVHAPNVDAVVFFCRDILPLVRRALSDVNVTVVGDRPPREILELSGAGISVTGWVPETASYLDSHCVGIAPLRFGAGMKGKVGEALAAGLPMVTTSIGAEGMDLEDGNTAMIADSPQAFADALVRLCTDPILHRRLSEEGRAHVRRQWDLTAVEGQLVAAIECLRAIRPKSMRSSEYIAAIAQDAYLRSGLAVKAQRVGSVAMWYANRVYRRFAKGSR